MGARCKRRIVWRSDATWWRESVTKKACSWRQSRRLLCTSSGTSSQGLYEGYSYLDQAISELGAFGSPVRPLMVTVIFIHGLLVLTFGVGVLRAGTGEASRGSAAFGRDWLVGIPTHTVWAMSSRDMESGFNDTMHIVLSAVFSALVIAAMVLSAVAYRGVVPALRARHDAVVVGFGMAASFAMQGIEQNNTPWAGGFERINARILRVALVLAVT